MYASCIIRYSFIPDLECMWIACNCGIMHLCSFKNNTLIYRINQEDIWNNKYNDNVFIAFYCRIKNIYYKIENAESIKEPKIIYSFKEKYIRISKIPINKIINVLQKNGYDTNNFIKYYKTPIQKYYYMNIKITELVFKELNDDNKKLLNENDELRMNINKNIHNHYNNFVIDNYKYHVQRNYVYRKKINNSDENINFNIYITVHGLKEL